MISKIKQGIMILGLLIPLASQAVQCQTQLIGDQSAAVCGASFINPPVFGLLCSGGSSTGIFTLQNNSTSNLRINNIHIVNNDPLPAAATVIIPAPVNNCGSFLAPGATCNIGVQLLPLVAGTINRILQVGVDSRQVNIDAPFTSIVGACTIPGPLPPPGFLPTIPGTPLVLFNAAILGAQTVTNTGPTLVSGDLDLTPGSSVTGFPPGTVVNGAINVNNPAAFFVKGLATTYFGQLNGLPCDHTFGPGYTLTQADIVGPGVYCFDSSVLINTNINLNGAPGQSYVFKTLSSTVTVGSNVIISTSGGIMNDNINWAVGSSATLGTNSVFVGIIDALASITITHGVTLNGRAWALNGQVTLDTNNVIPNP